MMRSISPAQHLLRMLEEKQTDAAGRIWYGRPITYSKIANWFGSEKPSERTLQRWMAELRADGKVIVRRNRMNQGMRVTIAAPRKHFRVVAESARRQMTLFSEPVKIPVQKPVEKLSYPQSDAPTLMAAPSRQYWRQKDVDSLKEHRNKQALASAREISNACAKPINCKGQNPFEEDRKPWTDAERAKKLSEFYGLKRKLADLPLKHRLHDKLTQRMHALEDELGRAAREVAFADTG
jgi:hypothetical protein